MFVDKTPFHSLASLLFARKIESVATQSQVQFFFLSIFFFSPLRWRFRAWKRTLTRREKLLNKKFYFLQLLIRDERDLSASRVVISINQIFFEGLFKHVLFKAFFCKVSSFVTSQSSFYVIMMFSFSNLVLRSSLCSSMFDTTVLFVQWWYWNYVDFLVKKGVHRVKEYFFVICFCSRIFFSELNFETRN